MSLLEETDPMQMIHWISRMDAGLDRYPKTDFCEWLIALVHRLDDAERLTARVVELTRQRDAATYLAFWANANPNSRKDETGRLVLLFHEDISGVADVGSAEAARIAALVWPETEGGGR